MVGYAPSPFGALGAVGVATPNGEASKTGRSGRQKGGLGVLGIKTDRYAVEGHFSGIWESVGLQASAPPSWPPRGIN